MTGSAGWANGYGALTADQMTMTVTDRLRQQHAEVLALFVAFDQAAGAQRAEIFDCLRRALAVHETAEEVVVYPAARLLGEEAVANCRSP